MNFTDYEEYTPPCWVNPTLQKTLKDPVKLELIPQIKNELWEASGGSSQGLVEFKKYLDRFRCFPDIIIRTLWYEEKQINPKNKLSPNSPTFVRRLCIHCEEIPVFDNKKICKSCFHAMNIVQKVVKSAID